MNMEFADAALKELYETGKTKDHKYNKLAMDVVKRVHPA